MTTELKAYRCENAACSLGSRYDHGHFTGGIPQDLAISLTGDPKAKHGDSYCSNCGEKGVSDGKHESHAGADPNQHHHDAVASRVADDNDPLTADGAQDALEALVGEEG